MVVMYIAIPGPETLVDGEQYVSEGVAEMRFRWRFRSTYRRDVSHSCSIEVSQRWRRGRQQLGATSACCILFKSHMLCTCVTLPVGVVFCCGCHCCCGCRNCRQNRCCHWPLLPPSLLPLLRSAGSHVALASFILRFSRVFPMCISVGCYGRCSRRSRGASRVGVGVRRQAGLLIRGSPPSHFSCVGKLLKRHSTTKLLSHGLAQD